MRISQKFIHTVLFFTLFSLSTKAQESINELSKSLYDLLISGIGKPESLYLDKMNYHQYIDDQKFGKTTTDEYKMKVNDRYDRELQDYVEVIRTIQQGYVDAKEEGATTTLGEIESQKLPGVLNTYAVSMVVQLDYPDENIPIVLRYTAVVVNGKWYIMGKPEEDQ